MTETFTPNSHADKAGAYTILDTASQSEHVIFEADSLQPRGETPEIAAELDQPIHIAANDMSLGAFSLNRMYEKEDVLPVTINLPLGEEAQSGSGRADLNAFAQTIQRPIIVIDMPGRGASNSTPLSKVAQASPEKIARAYLVAYDQLGVTRFDAIGMSMGSLLAAKIAELAGERLTHLITFSAPSFDARSAWQLYRNSREHNIPDFRLAREMASPAVRQELEMFKRERRAIHETLPMRTKAKNFSVVLKQAGLVRADHMNGLSERLSPKTVWFDVVGSEDAFTDWHDHLEEVRKRNKQYPGSADFTVLDSETHAWLAVHRWDMAALAAAKLEIQESE